MRGKIGQRLLTATEKNMKSFISATIRVLEIYKKGF